MTLLIKKRKNWQGYYNKKYVINCDDMKKTNILFVMMLVMGWLPLCSKEHFIINSHYISDYKKFSMQSIAQAVKKNAFFITAAAIALYYHKDSIDFIKNRPYLSSLFLYGAINYICDAIIQYHEQESLLEVIALVKEISLYLVIGYGIKNYIHQKNIPIKDFINEDNFLHDITQHVSYSFDDIAIISIKAYRELKSTLRTLNVNIPIESEEFVFLCNSSTININSLLYLTQNNPALYQMISRFKKNPDLYCPTLVNHLTSHLTKAFITLEKYLLKPHGHERIG